LPVLAEGVGFEPTTEV